MNSMKTLIVIFFISLLLITLSSGDLIEDVCRTSNNFKLCNESLRAVPKSYSADKKGLVRILLQQSITIAKNIYNEVVHRLEQAKELVLKECLHICKENYDGAIEDAKSSLKAFDANDFFVTRTSAGAVMTGPDTCEELFTEPPVRISPIKSKKNFLGSTLTFDSTLTSIFDLDFTPTLDPTFELRPDFDT
ncbi:hypothetical protein H5410_053085 [Solanum commersonii]|uniref:Pectinesterase inhibitor domain-containing protein n=1 Tax=Solanum commersonii TaxID=4109 RepID=A0A9J5X3D5_SOLCO|nr:hypothetical protein H5410_053085 [Solanum commersonii]